MAAPDIRRDDDIISNINIIPFVDIVLVLLIIFMLTSTAIVKAAIRVELPKAANAGNDVATTLNLVITKERRLYLDGEEVSREQASARIKGKAKESPELQMVISADKVLPYGEVVALIDFVKGCGVKVFALNIEKEIAGAM